MPRVRSAAATVVSNAAEPPTFKCNDCDYVTKHKGDIGKHRLSKHTDPSEIDWQQCETCPTKCKTKGQLNKHVRERHGEKTFKCSDCEYATTTATNLKRHVTSVHGNTRSFACAESGCGMKFNTLSNLQDHTARRHLDERRYKCQLCDHSCKSSSDLAKHVSNKHSDQRPFTCFQCEYSCKQKQSLDGHVRRVHSDERAFQCAQCDHKSKTAADLKVHCKHVHSDQRDVECDDCHRQFKTNAHLKLHNMRFHSDEKSFVCEVDECEASFKTPVDLTQHLKTRHEREFNQSRKIEEEKIRLLLDAHAIAYKREHSIDFVCVGDIDNNRAFIDFVLIFQNQIIFLECDERQHKYGYDGVSCDMKRMSKIMESLALGGNTLPVTFIRHNPHGYYVGDSYVRVDREVREETLLNIIDDISQDANNQKPLRILYMYYDVVDEQSRRLCIHENEEYHQHMKDCCLPPVI